MEQQRKNHSGEISHFFGSFCSWILLVLAMRIGCKAKGKVRLCSIPRNQEEVKAMESLADFKAQLIAALSQPQSWTLGWAIQSVDSPGGYAGGSSAQHGGRDRSIGGALITAIMMIGRRY